MSDPNNIFGIDASTTVYPALRLVDAWGILGVTDGAWLVRDANGHLVRAQVPAPASASARPLKGQGWSLELKKGWEGPRRAAGQFYDQGSIDPSVN